jgi:hypothetical protein
MMIRGMPVAVAVLLAGCATEAVRTPLQARNIALASVCAKRQALLVTNEAMPTEWVAERRGDRWYAWLPFGPGAQYSGVAQYGHMGAWINAKDGKILYCETGVSQALSQTEPELKRRSPP